MISILSIFAASMILFFWLSHRLLFGNQAKQQKLYGDLLTYFRIGDETFSACYRIRIIDDCIYLHPRTFGVDYIIPLKELVEVTKIDRTSFFQDREFKWKRERGIISLDGSWSEIISERLRKKRPSRRKLGGW